MSLLRNIGIGAGAFAGGAMLGPLMGLARGKGGGGWNFAGAVKPWQDAWANIAPGVIEDQQAEAEARAHNRPYPFTGAAGPQYDKTQARQQWSAQAADAVRDWREGRQPYYDALQSEYINAMQPAAEFARADDSRRGQFDIRRRGLSGGSRDYAVRSNNMMEYANALQGIERGGYQLAQGQREQDMETEEGLLRRLYSDMPGDMAGYQTEMDYLRSLTGQATELGTINSDRARAQAGYEQDMSRVWGSTMSNLGSFAKEHGADIYRGIRDRNRRPATTGGVI